MNRDPMDLTPKETPEQYAQRRANETGQPYLVTGLGQSFMDCRLNRKLAKDCLGIRARFTKEG